MSALLDLFYRNAPTLESLDPYSRGLIEDYNTNKSNVFGGLLHQQLRERQQAYADQFMRDSVLPQYGPERLQQEQMQLLQQLDNERATAIDAMRASTDQLREQSERKLSSPLAAPITVPTMSPANPMTNVQTSDAYAGTNAAENKFYVSPESTQSQFAVGAPVGGISLSQRTKGSTERLGGKTDTLGSKRKDEL